MNRRTNRRGLTLLELLAVVTIIGVISAVIVPRISGGTSEAKSGSCHVQKGVTEVQCALWRRATGSWPTTSLTDIGNDVDYFPEGLPICPVDGSSYTIDDSGRVVGHQH